MAATIRPAEPPRRLHRFLRPLLGHVTGRGFRGLPLADRVYRWYLRRVAPRSVRIDGHTFELDATDALRLLSRDQFEPGTSALVRRLVRPGDVVLDVGAHIGYYSCLFARLVGERGSVVAVEPDPDNFALLRRNVAANGYRNVQFVQAAAAARSGPLRLYRSPRETGDHRTHAVDGWASREVPGMALDDVTKAVRDRMALVKMDVQGAEGAALEGLRETLIAEGRALVLMEFWPAGLRRHGTDPLRILSGLSGDGWRLYYVHAETGELREHDPVSLVRVADDGIDTPNVLCVPRGASLDELRLP